MKVTIQQSIPVLILSILLLGAISVFAQEETSVESEATTTETTRENLQDRVNAARENSVERQETRADVQNQIQERKTEIQENIAERKEALTARVQERIVNLAANMSNRLDGAANRMQNLVDRLDARMVKMNENGFDTAEAEQHLADAQAAVDAAKLNLARIDQVISDAVTAADPRAMWQTSKTEFLTIKENIITAHTALRATVAALKVAVVPTEEVEVEEVTE